MTAYLRHKPLAFVPFAVAPFRSIKPQDRIVRLVSTFKHFRNRSPCFIAQCKSSFHRTCLLFLFALLTLFLQIAFLAIVIVPTSIFFSFSRSDSYSKNLSHVFLQTPHGILSGQSLTQGLFIMFLLSVRKICGRLSPLQTAGFRAIRCCTI